MGRYDNGASVPDITWAAGISKGSVEKFTERCQITIMAHHDSYVQALTVEEKEGEKGCIERETRCVGWQDDYLMYDGTPIGLFQQLSLKGSLLALEMQLWDQFTGVL